MCFYGIQQISIRVGLSKFFENRGGNSNAFTSKHETNYQLSLPPKYSV
ncbi:MAG: insulinase family protein [Bdellovibrionales bacterium]|nr:insulinase family protein [Bdellovibrionales bacterium]